MKRLVVAVVFVGAAFVYIPQAPSQPSGKTAVSEALGKIEGFTTWDVSDGSSTVFSFAFPRGVCDLPGDNPSAYSITRLDHHMDIHLDDASANHGAKRLHEYIVQYLLKSGWRRKVNRLGRRKLITETCFERSAAVIAILDTCDRCSMNTPKPYDGVAVLVISPAK